MKKTILALAVILTVGLTSAFANRHEDINQNVVTAFRADFGNAREVSWEQTKEFVKATFTLNGQVQCAYYDQRGELMAVIHHVLSNQLPKELSENLKKGYIYANYWVSDLLEMTADGQHSYYVSLENGDERVILKSDGKGEWKYYRKFKKDLV